MAVLEVVVKRKGAVIVAVFQPRGRVGRGVKDLLPLGLSFGEFQVGPLRRRIGANYFFSIRCFLSNALVASMVLTSPPM